MKTGLGHALSVVTWCWSMILVLDDLKVVNKRVLSRPMSSKNSSPLINQVDENNFISLKVKGNRISRILTVLIFVISGLFLLYQRRVYTSRLNNR